ncbi:MAG: hypothetical protein ACI8V2_001148 [Candidatus Latescibacterota bacterium]|jgi:hypothetical protein
MNLWTLSLVVLGMGWSSQARAQYTTPVAEVPSETMSQKATGNLLVETNAPNSRVFVNGSFLGVAVPSQPLMLYRAGVGKVALRVVADGFVDFEREIELQANKWRLVVATLEKKVPVQVRKASSEGE